MKSTTAGAGATIKQKNPFNRNCNKCYQFRSITNNTAQVGECALWGIKLYKGSFVCKQYAELREVLPTIRQIKEK